MGPFLDDMVRIEEDRWFLKGFEPLFGGEFEVTDRRSRGWMFGVEVNPGDPAITEFHLLGIFAASEGAAVAGSSDFLVLLVGPIA